jgi:hypothetical protein
VSLPKNRTLLITVTNSKHGSPQQKLGMEAMAQQMEKWMAENRVALPPAVSAPSNSSTHP